MEVIQPVAAVTLVLGLLAAALWWLRRRGIAAVMPGRRAGGRRLECLERLPLGAQHTLHLVRLGGQAMLVASSPRGCVLLAGVSCREIEAGREGLQ